MTETKKTLVERLFAEQGRALQAFLYRRVRRHPDAAELAQEVYLRMLRVTDVTAIRNPEAYLYTVASNLANEHARDEHLEGSALDIDDPLVQEQLAELPAFASQLDAEQRFKRLPDDSLLHLNTDTADTVRFSSQERLVTLILGEADFEVAHAPGRPFRVLAGPAEVVDLGSRFDVRLQHSSTLVTVLEGRVAVGPAPRVMTGKAPDDTARSVRLGADEQITVTDGQLPATPVPVDAQRATAWLHRQMMFDREPLERVAGEFNRYATQQIEIITPGLRTLEVSGVFGTDDNEALLAFLRSLDGVHVETTATTIRVSQN